MPPLLPFSVRSSLDRHFSEFVTLQLPLTSTSMSSLKVEPVDADFILGSDAWTKHVAAFEAAKLDSDSDTDLNDVEVDSDKVVDVVVEVEAIKKNTTNTNATNVAVLPVQISNQSLVLRDHVPTVAERDSSTPLADAIPHLPDYSPAPSLEAVKLLAVSPIPEVQSCMRKPSTCLLDARKDSGVQLLNTVTRTRIRMV
ncbi:hypothetical protein BCR33DRAFT_520158 [Rhizoclosmatium globosum]|uniref:Uncharacterized protein n=1 Tax=Rhizoclosmatium globosum TaxID=329046 RepID=A0A1Y2BFL1_9FUNG|nr:hypothetical protein BCR33DRAFT_520158 [Rhizoclosmatium globosum]|eukprot:ORY33608.1 hypothetical protein BCR33DRAFT_520158 [Rhizoclosmatium globosum]